jgi:hypothetical protein
MLSPEKETAKRINEMLGAAYALVGANVETEVRDLRSLPTRQGRRTADFEATLVRGNIVRIETCGLTNELEQLYINALSAIGHRAGVELAKHPDVMAKSPYFVRFYKRVVGPRDIKAVSSELAALLINEGPGARKTPSMSRVTPQYPLLHALERTGPGSKIRPAGPVSSSIPCSTCSAERALATLSRYCSEKKQASTTSIRTVGRSRSGLRCTSGRR